MLSGTQTIQFTILPQRRRATRGWAGAEDRCARAVCSRCSPMLSRPVDAGGVVKIPSQSLRRRTAFGQANSTVLVGLHHQHRLAKANAGFVDRLALDRRRVGVGVIELDQDRFNLRVLSREVLQHLGFVAEGDADAADFSLDLELLHHLKDAAGGAVN